MGVAAGDPQLPHKPDPRSSALIQACIGSGSEHGGSLLSLGPCQVQGTYCQWLCSQTACKEPCSLLQAWVTGSGNPRRPATARGCSVQIHPRVVSPMKTHSLVGPSSSPPYCAPGRANDLLPDGPAVPWSSDRDLTHHRDRRAVGGSLSRRGRPREGAA